MLDLDFEELGYDETEDLYEEQDDSYDDLRDTPIDQISRNIYTDY